MWEVKPLVRCGSHWRPLPCIPCTQCTAGYFVGFLAMYLDEYMRLMYNVKRALMHVHQRLYFKM